ncbi:MAG: endolytic transglycosylase MltG [Candidatus Nomurabacteria bacterium]|nr:endolytic transglycosylase MltG [Candidatus Nomurabacteria bacterium]
MDPIPTEEKLKTLSFPSFFHLIIVFILVVCFLGYNFLLNAPKNFPIGYILTINQGESLHSVSLQLKEANIIHSRTVFESIVIIYGGEKKIAPGDYLFERKVGVFEVASRIVGADWHLNKIKVTIPEGFNNNDISQIFTTKLIHFDGSIFSKLSQGKEGYLFPDTYFFFPKATAEDVVNIMSDNFNRKIRPFGKEIINSGKSENQIITMASLIEREAKGDSDRGVISGILWNRINKGLALQVDSAPNTYKTKGLPASPICNPGIPSIISAIHPTQSEYLFYLHDKIGNIHYAKTFTEHKANIKKYLK